MADPDDPAEIPDAPDAPDDPADLAAPADPAAQPGEPPGPEQAPEPAPEPAPEQADQADQASREVEGRRRRERRERAERRAAQARAEAIEQARREAKRRTLGGPPPTPVPRGAVRGLKVALATALGVVAVVGAGLILYFTPVMSARSVEVTGIEAIPLEEVLDAAQVRIGTPLLQIDTGRVAGRVAEIRRVASVRVQRGYPSTLRIGVVERVAVVVHDFPDGPHLFDRGGVDFATEPPPPMLPYLDVDDPGPDDPVTRAALQVMTALAPEVAGQVGRVAAESVDSIALTLADGRVVVWGSTDRTPEKARKLAALLTQPGRTYDVSSPDLPTVR